MDEQVGEPSRERLQFLVDALTQELDELQRKSKFKEKQDQNHLDILNIVKNDVKHAAKEVKAYIGIKKKEIESVADSMVKHSIISHFMKQGVVNVEALRIIAGVEKMVREQEGLRRRVAEWNMYAQQAEKRLLHLRWLEAQLERALGVFTVKKSEIQLVKIKVKKKVKNELQAND